LLSNFSLSRDCDLGKVAMDSSLGILEKRAEKPDKVAFPVQFDMQSSSLSDKVAFAADPTPLPANVPDVDSNSPPNELPNNIVSPVESTSLPDEVASPLESNSVSGKVANQAVDTTSIMDEVTRAATCEIKEVLRDCKSTRKKREKSIIVEGKFIQFSIMYNLYFGGSQVVTLPEFL